MKRNTGILIAVAAIAAVILLFMTRRKAPSGPVPISEALPASFNTPAVLNSIYDATNSNLVYNPARPPELNTLTALTPGRAYIVFTNVNVTVTIGRITYTFTATLPQTITFTP